jgi:HK97 family phage major capsid protein
MTIEELVKQLQDHIDEARSIREFVNSEARHQTAEESAKIAEHLQAAKAIEEEIGQSEDLNETEQRVATKLAEPQPTKSQLGDPEQNAPDVEADELTVRNVPTTVTRKIAATPVDNRHRGSHGFRTFGEFLQATVKAGDRTHRSIDPRLEVRTAATTFGNELSGPDGGFAVPPDYVNSINELIRDEDGLLARTDQMTSASNSITIPIDDDSPWSTSGIVAAWEGEGDAFAQKKPLLKQNEVRLNKLGVVVPMTEEILEDASALNSYVPRKAASKINFKIDLAILQGSGMGQPQGILTAPSIISVAKGSTAADSIGWENVRDMWGRLYAPSRPTSVWIANQDLETEMQKMFFTEDVATPAVSAIPVYLPAGNNLANPNQTTLFGRPVIFHQACETKGDLGDIFLVDLTQYLTVTKGGGIRSDMSMHLWFDQDMVAFKFRIRIGGLPWWPTTLAARDGTTTYSPFITLAERA